MAVVPQGKEANVKTKFSNDALGDMPAARKIFALERQNMSKSGLDMLPSLDLFDDSPASKAAQGANSVSAKAERNSLPEISGAGARAVDGSSGLVGEKDVAEAMGRLQDLLKDHLSAGEMDSVGKPAQRFEAVA